MNWIADKDVTGDFRRNKHHQVLVNEIPSSKSDRDLNSRTCFAGRLKYEQ